jgi:hypothetical protein
LNEPEGQKSILLEGRIRWRRLCSWTATRYFHLVEGRIAGCWKNEKSEGIGGAGMPWATGVFLEVPPVVKKTLSQLR